MNNNTILAIVFLMAGTLLTTAVTTMVPAAYADNKNKAEDESAAALADCDENEVERAGFDCIAVAEIGDNGNGGNGNGELTTICHVAASGVEIELDLPPSAAEAHLEQHEDDYPGPCTGRST